MLDHAMRMGAPAGGGTRPRVRAILPVLAAAALVAVLLLPPAPATAGCGGVQSARAKKKVNPGGKAPLAIGDSVMLLAIPELSRAGYQVNARGCRQWAEGMGVIRFFKRHHRLPHLVVVALGADWVITGHDIRQALHVLGKRRVLGLVVPRELGGGTSHDAVAVVNGWRTHEKRVVLLNWVSYSRGHGSWFQPDGLHLTFKGAARFARLLGMAVPYAKTGAFPQGAHYPR